MVSSSTVVAVILAQLCFVVGRDSGIRYRPEDVVLVHLVFECLAALLTLAVRTVEPL